MTEEEILKFWREKKIFEKSLDQNKDKKLFSFFDGPPFATGLPHYGHILASIIKDLVGRYQTMKGCYVPRRWGWDCHGLPIENIIEKKLNISGKKEIEKIGVDKFNQACQNAVLKYSEEWGEMVERIGRWVDFKHSYKTMDSTYVESVWWALKEIWEKGLLYEGKKVLLYCPRCETPISNFEVAMDNSYNDVKEETITVAFKLEKNDKFPKNTYLLAWTTTPWTLPANVVLAVGEKIKYELVNNGNNNYLLAQERRKIYFKRTKARKTFLGRELVGLKYEPLYGVVKDNAKAYSVFSADFVITNEGTGIVHTAVVYGEDDYNLGLKYDLPTAPFLDERGHFNELAPKFLQGKYFKQADKIIILDLKKRKLIFKKQALVHSYPFCWRCNTQLYYNAIPAWFINIQKIKKFLLATNESINWYPEHLKHGRFAKGIEDAPDWNISRNRYWATPIPIWKCEGLDCNNLVVIGSFTELKEKSLNFNEIYPSDEVRKADLHKHKMDKIKLKCGVCRGEMKRVPEVLDCWVESASMPFAELHYPFENEEKFNQHFPAQFVAEYISQTRAWFYTMHVISTILFNKAPFENVVTTGTILNEKGEKLSKSKNNYPDPRAMIEKHGVDALRFYLMSSVVMKSENILFSEHDLDEIKKKVIIIISNVLSFYRLYPLQEKNKFLPEKENLHTLDGWIMARLSQLVKETTEYLDKYDVIRASREITFFISDLSTWYLRRSRDRFKEGSESGSQVFYYVLLTLAKIMAPLTPFIAENIYQELKGPKESVHLDDWPETQKDYLDEKLIESMTKTREVVALALGRRAEAGIKIRQPLSKLTINTSLGEEFLELIKDEVNVEKVGYKKSKEEVALDTEITPELKEKGVVRDLIREINALRKKEGLTIKDRTKIIFGADIKTKKIIKKYKEEILESTLS
ncbi:isoleucine--tRNA ligase, partial [Patescibacteria group bacterium]|nr:isoleucine--tRNA ligase [Patescibacteria group bacterium]